MDGVDSILRKDVDEAHTIVESRHKTCDNVARRVSSSTIVTSNSAPIRAIRLLAKLATPGCKETQLMCVSSIYSTIFGGILA